MTAEDWLIYPTLDLFLYYYFYSNSKDSQPAASLPSKSDRQRFEGPWSGFVYTREIQDTIAFQIDCSRQKATGRKQAPIAGDPRR